MSSYDREAAEAEMRNERRNRFVQSAGDLQAAMTFIRSTPPEVKEQANSFDPRSELLRWAKTTQGRALEGVELAAGILREVDAIWSPLAGSFEKLRETATELDADAESTRTWLDQRSEEHPTWVPHLDLYLARLYSEAETILRGTVTKLESRRLAAVAETVPVEAALTSGLIKVIRRPIEELSPDEFEILVAEFLDAMGLQPTRVGQANTPDGGIDIVAVPRRIVFPFILAVQVKHHRGTGKTGAQAVTHFAGSLCLHRIFSAGLLVTNTSFTPSAHWVATHTPIMLHLRDQNDLQSWIKGQFLKSIEWREMPATIELGSGIVIPIPRPPDNCT
jgi:hypothetical protein